MPPILRLQQQRLNSGTRVIYDNDGHVLILLYSTSSFTLYPGQSKNVTVTIREPAEAKKYQIFSGYIQVSITKTGNVAVDQLKVSYTGVVGDWKSAPVWSRKSLVLGNIQNPNQISEGIIPTGLYDSGLAAIPNKGTMNATEGAILWTPISTSSKNASIFIEPTNKKTSDELDKLGIGAGVAKYTVIDSSFPIQNLQTPRNAPFTRGQNQVFPVEPLNWNGQVTNELGDFVDLPAGDYRIVFAALRNFGNPALYPQDYDLISSTFSLVHAL